MPRLGLRAQIILALSVVFVVSFALLGTAMVRLARAAGERDRARAAELWVDSLGTLVEASPEPERVLDAALARPLVQGRIAGVRLEHPGTAPIERGRRAEREVSVPLGDGGRLTAWINAGAPSDPLPLGNLLSFYVTMTGLAVLVLAYIALTYLTVRPLTQLTRSSELLAAGAQHVRVPETGAAEVVRLAQAFNTMAEELRAERTRLEERLRELERTTADLRNAQQQVIHGEKLASVGRLAAGIAHEIGNPLSAILGLVELLRDPAIDAALRGQFLERIQGETERIHRIIRDLLDFARREPIEDVRSETADLAEVVRDAVNLVEPQKASRDVRFEVTVASGLSRVVGPQTRLTQVVLNLLLNAVDALGGKGHVRVEVVAGERDDEILLSVQDDGPGIAPEIADRLFEPFTTTKPVGKGTGLGLAVCHALVEAIGGRIGAENAPDGGARFSIHLKRATRSVPPGRVSSRPSAPLASGGA